MFKKVGTPVNIELVGNKKNKIKCKKCGNIVGYNYGGVIKIKNKLGNFKEIKCKKCGNIIKL